MTVPLIAIRMLGEKKPHLQGQHASGPLPHLPLLDVSATDAEIYRFFDNIQKSEKENTTEIDPL